MRIKVVQSSISLITSIPTTLVLPSDLIRPSPRAFRFRSILIGSNKGMLPGVHSWIAGWTIDIAVDELRLNASKGERAVAWEAAVAHIWNSIGYSARGHRTGILYVTV